MEAWKVFKDSFELNNLEENKYFPAHSFFSKKKNSISALAAGEKDIYILESYSDRIIVYDTHKETIREFNTDSLFSYDVGVSADNSTALVSGYQLTGDRYSAIATEHRTDTGRLTGRSIRGLYKARYFRGGVIGLRSELHNNCIVFEDFNGMSEILFQGSEELVFSGPQSLDEERIVFIAARKGERALLLYNYVTGELFQIDYAAGSVEADHSYWRYMRGLNVSDGKILFSHNSDDRMYKLASVDLDTMQAFFSSRDFSGGVFYPVSADNTVYYSAAFFSGDSFLRFPEPGDKISGAVVNINLVKQNPADYGSAKKNNQTSLSDSVSGTEDRELSADSLLSAYNSSISRPYFGIAYMNPFKLWLPLPLLRMMISDDDFKINPDGAGLFTVMMDPTDRNMIIAFAYADIKYRMAMIETFLWQTTVPGFPVQLEFSDKVTDDLILDPFRETRVSLIASFNHYPGRWGYSLSLGAGFLSIAESGSARIDSSAYEWEETKSAFVINAGLSFSNLRRGRDEIFGNGFSFSMRGSSLVWASYTDGFFPRAEGSLRANTEIRLPLNLTLYGAYDLSGMNLHGTSRVYGKPLFENNASKEYPLPRGLNLQWLAGGEMSVGLFSIEIQNNLGHAYYNRFLGTLTLRNAVYDSQGIEGTEGIAINDIRLAQSLVLNLKLVASIIPVKALPIFLEPNLWGAWKFSNTITGEGLPWAFGFAFNYRY